MVFFDAGGGHRAAATALKAVMAERYPHWRIELVNLQEVLEPVDLFHKVTGHQSQNFYNGILKRGWTYGSLTMLRGLQRGIRFYADHIEEVLEAHWRRSDPDLLVSLIPNFNGVMYRAFRRIHPVTPYVTVMTDLADCPPHFWQEKQDQFVVCGTDMAVRQAETMGYAPDRIFRASGMILRPGFYQPATNNRRAEREKLGLDPELPTALVMFGGYGSVTAAKIVEKLGKSQLKLQIIVLCGHNEKLKAKLEGRPNCLPVGFTDRVADYMHVADFFIGKPGPGSISEALQMGLPAIIERNRKTMPQERYNATWLEENRLGVVLRDFKDIAAAVRHLLEDGRLEALRCNARQLDNRAVFEIPDMFARILEKSQDILAA
jgi:1,2-diacylglycerol 3-beta-galactosyltransferase